MGLGPVIGLVTLCLLGATLAPGSPGAAQTPAATLPKNFAEFKDTAGRFAVFFPKDWKIVPGFGDVVATFVQSGVEAAVVVERLIAPMAFDTNTPDFLADETDRLKSRHADAQQITSNMVPDAQRGVVFDFTRGSHRGPERVRQYSFLVGTILFRLTCIAPANKFDKYQPAFADVARNVKALQVPGAGEFVGSH